MKLFYKVFLFCFCISNIFFTNIVSAESNPCLNNDVSNFTFHVNNQIDSRINLSNPNTGLDIFTDRPIRASSSWIRNPNSWTQKGIPLDFTGVMGSNNDLAHHANNPYQGGATLITPRHFITANHFGFENGTLMNFYDKNGNVVTRKLVKSMNISGTDISVGLLDSDVDSSITYYPLINSSLLYNLISKPNNYYFVDIPIVIFNQNAQAIVNSMIQKNIANSIDHAVYSIGPKSNYTKYLGMGDSGQPGFIIVNNKPILLFTNHLSDEGPNLGDYINDINSTIVSLGNGNGYRVTEYNPNGFNLQTSFCTEPAIPKPTNFKANYQTTCLVDNSQSKVDLSWDNPTNTSLISGYQYQLSIDGGTPYYFQISKTGYTDTNVKPGSSYSYSLKLSSSGNLSSVVTTQAKLPDLCSTNNPLNTNLPNPTSTTIPLPVNNPVNNPVVPYINTTSTKPVTVVYQPQILPTKNTTVTNINNTPNNIQPVKQTIDQQTNSIKQQNPTTKIINNQNNEEQINTNIKINNILPSKKIYEVPTTTDEDVFINNTPKVENNIKSRIDVIVGIFKSIYKRILSGIVNIIIKI